MGDMDFLRLVSSAACAVTKRDGSAVRGPLRVFDALNTIMSNAGSLDAAQMGKANSGLGSRDSLPAHRPHLPPMQMI